MTTRGVTLAALLAVLDRPAWWILALAGFLARGGVLLFVLAVVTLPSPLALSNVVAPLLVPLAFGQVSQEAVAVLAVGILSVLAWIVAGGWIGAATEVVLIRDAWAAATEEGLPSRPEPAGSGWLIFRVGMVRLLAHLPLVIAIAFGAVQVVKVAYVELTNPSEVVTPLPIRIIVRAIGPVIVIIVAWLIGETVGGLAARRIVLGGQSILGAIRDAIGDLLRRPASTVLPAVFTMVVLAADLAATLAAVDLTWTAARVRLTGVVSDPRALGLGLAAFAAAWCLALAVTGLIDAWRSVAMTFEGERAAVAESAAGAAGGGSTHNEEPGPSGTFGASTHRRPGDWSTGDRGGSL